MPIFDEAAAVEAMARAICQAREQNGGPAWEYWLAQPGRGKHVLNAFRDDAQAALGALKLFLGGWQTMESAPKDGTRVDLWVVNSGWAGPDSRDEFRLADAYWCEDKPRSQYDYPLEIISGWHAPNKSYEGEDGYAGLNDPERVLKDGRVVWDRATHWMPLPPSPDKGGE